MPLYNWSQLFNKGAREAAVTALGGTLVFAWRTKSRRLHLGTATALEVQGQTLEHVHATEQPISGGPALATLRDNVYVAWKGEEDGLNVARVVLEPQGSTWRVAGLADLETLEDTGDTPLSLVAYQDRLVLTAGREKTSVFFEILVPDPTAVDPLGPVGAAAAGMESACEIRLISYKDESYLVSCGDAWGEGGRLLRDRLLLGPGWYSLFLALKEGQPDVYHSGDSSEWQSIAGEQVYLDEQGDEAFDDSWMENEDDEDGDESDEGDRASPVRNPPYWHHLAISNHMDITGYVAALDAIDEQTLRAKYDALRETEYASRLSDEDFAAAWQTLQELREFLRRAAQAELYTLHRMRRPADAPIELPPEPEVTTSPPAPSQVGEAAPGGPGVLARAMDSFGVAPNHPDNEWPFNLLSQRTVRYQSGRLGRAGDPPPLDFDPVELERCLQAAAGFAARLDRLPVRTGDLGRLEPFAFPVTREETSRQALTPERVRTLFRGTLHPWADIRIESLEGYNDIREIGNEAGMYGYRSRDVRLHNLLWDDALAWLKNQPGVQGLWYVAVEPGYGPTGIQAVRLLVGLTDAGSLTGAVTVELGSALTRTLELGAFHAEYQRQERENFGAWQDPQTREYVARATLRAYDAQAFEAWESEVAQGVRALRQEQEEAYRLAMYRQLPAPRRELPLGTTWNPLHRCLAVGYLLYYYPDETTIFLAPQAPGEDRATPASHHTWRGEDLNRILAILNERDEAWLRTRYQDLRATGYAHRMSEADYQATLQAFRDLKDFVRTAASEGWVIDHEMTTRTPEQLAESLVLPEAAEQRAAPAPDLQPGEVADCVANNTYLAPLQPCMVCYYSEDEDNEWDNTSVSKYTVRYSCGNIGRTGEQVFHRHDPEELRRCQSLASQAAEVLRAVEPAHDQGGPFLPFFVTANVGEPVGQSFTEEFVRRRVFAGVLCPENGMHIEPMRKGGLWWEGYVLNHWVEEEQEAENAKWSGFVDWFLAQPGLHGHAFLEIGLGDDDTGSTHPRLAVALTDQGSVVGVCGYVIFG